MASHDPTGLTIKLQFLMLFVLNLPIKPCLDPAPPAPFPLFDLTSFVGEVYPTGPCLISLMG